MNINQMIRTQLLILSNKYDMSLIEIQNIKDGKIGKTYNFNYRLKNTENINISKRFNNKRELVSWLLCLN